MAIDISVLGPNGHGSLMSATAYLRLSVQLRWFGRGCLQPQM